MNRQSGDRYQVGAIPPENQDDPFTASFEEACQMAQALQDAAYAKHDPFPMHGVWLWRDGFQPELVLALIDGDCLTA